MKLCVLCSFRIWLRARPAAARDVIFDQIQLQRYPISMRRLLTVFPRLALFGVILLSSLFPDGARRCLRQRHRFAQRDGRGRQPALPDCRPWSDGGADPRLCRDVAHVETDHADPGGAIYRDRTRPARHWRLRHSGRRFGHEDGGASAFMPWPARSALRMPKSSDMTSA